MTQNTKHHEDVATITVHFHEDELLAYAKWRSTDTPAATPIHEMELAVAVEDRLLLAAGDVLQADRAKRRAPKA